MNLRGPKRNISLKTLFLGMCLILFGVTVSCSQPGVKNAVAARKMPPRAQPTPLHPMAAQKRAVFARAYANLPLYFIANRGQVNGKVAFYEKGWGHTTFFTRKGIVLGLEKPQAKAGPRTREAAWRKVSGAKSLAANAADVRTSYLKIDMVGMNKDVQVAPEGLQPGKVNYFVGNDPHKWHTNIPTYRAILYKNAWPGIDIKFYGNNRRLEYDIIAKPGADPSLVRFRYTGAKEVRVTQSGDLAVELASGAVIQQKPVVYQLLDGRRVMRRGAFVVRAASASAGQKASLRTFTCGFDLGRYDTKAPLVVDPTLLYSTYLGGSGNGSNGDAANGIAVDASGNIYVTGYTNSTNFPVSNTAFQHTPATGNALTQNAFVTEIAAGGTSLVYSTYLGGDANYYQTSSAIAIDASGNAYITGATDASDFPVTNNAFQNTLNNPNGGPNAFVAELAAGGASLAYSTYLGGSGNSANSFAGDQGVGIAVDASGNIYVTGFTDSIDFPVTSGIFQNTLKSRTGGNAFVTEIAAVGTSLVYSTFLGGSGKDGDAANAIAIDASGNAYVTGRTFSTDFPVTNPAFQNTQNNTNSGPNAFVTELAAGGSSLVYSTYLGGSGNSNSPYFGDSGVAIAIDASGNAYVTGYTYSSDFPVTNGVFQNTLKSNDGDNAFVTELAAGGASLVYSTYLGGSSFDGGMGQGIAVDASGNAYVTGYTFSSDFPVTNDAFQHTFNNSKGGTNAFVTVLPPGGRSLLYSTYLGGNGTAGDVAACIALGRTGNIYIAGQTDSAHFPLTGNAFQNTLNSIATDNAFVTEISAVAGLWENAVATGNGWYYLSPLGSFYLSSSGWIYHQTLGSLYPVGTSTESIWFYDPQWDGTGGWWWTNSSFFPWLYSTTENQWLYFDAKDSTPALRWFFTAAGQASTH